MRSVVMAAGLALACGAAAARAQTALEGGPAGLWGHEAVLGPRVRGEVLLQRAGALWTLRAAGLEAAASARGDSIRISLPGGQGMLRARVEDGGRTVRGFWIQPPVGAYRFASPVALRRVAAGTYRGEVAPLDDRISLYLDVRPAADGSLRGAFHNPEANWTGGAPWFRVTVDGDVLALADSAGRVRYRQPYDAEGRRITMDFGAPFALTPLTADQAAGFHPRSPSAPPYAYRAPVPDDDGWPVGRASEVGMDETLLRDFVRRIAGGDPTAPGAPRIHSVLVARHGRLVLDEYFFGYSRDRLHDLRSAAKTFTSVLAGVAVDQGRLTIDTPVYPLLGASADDPRRERITVGHLLTHTSGLACDDNDPASPGNEDTMQGQQAQPDWTRYTLDLPVAREPGAAYAYCSGGINLAGAAVAAATDTWLPDLFDEHVARPLGITRYAVNLTPTGEGYGGGGTYLRPRDLLKLGQAYLDGGVWRGRRIVSRRWVEASTAHHVDVPGGSSDGYAWHRHTLRWDGRAYEAYEASGNGGQMLIVVPALDLVVVFTGGNYNRAAIWRRFRDEMVPAHVIAAVRR